MKTPVRARIEKANVLIKRAYSLALRRISPGEREFRRIWPTVDSIEGLLVSPVQERWLYQTARSLPEGAIIVEIGAFKGRSTCCLAYGCKNTKKHVFAIDTFDGNDVDFRCRGFFQEFCRHIDKCGLSAYVTPVRGWSADAAKIWDEPIHLLFIDGSHQYQDVLTDFFGFFPHVVSGGIVAVHDVVETWPGPLRAWNEVIQHRLDNIGACSTLAYGTKPR